MIETVSWTLAIAGETMLSRWHVRRHRESQRTSCGAAIPDTPTLTQWNDYHDLLLDERMCTTCTKQVVKDIMKEAS